MNHYDKPEPGSKSNKKVYGLNNKVMTFIQFDSDQEKEYIYKIKLIRKN